MNVEILILGDAASVPTVAITNEPPTLASGANPNKAQPVTSITHQRDAPGRRCVPRLRPRHGRSSACGGTTAKQSNGIARARMQSTLWPHTRC